MSAVQLDELSGERKPKPGPFDLLVRGPHLPELLEDRDSMVRLSRLG